MKGIDKDKFTVVVWDPTGYGQSRPPERDYSGNYFQRDANYLIELLQKVGFDKYSLLGWSQGAVTAIHLAATAPENVQSLIGFGTFAYIDEVILSDRPIARIENWSAEMRAPFLKMYGEDYLRRSWEGWAQSCARFLREQGGDMGHKKLLNKVKCPTLIIHGEEDPIVPVEHAHFLHKNIQNSKLYIWPKGKHNLQLRYPDEFNKMVADFVLANAK
jgi:valacyclovir hydrolase